MRAYFDFIYNPIYDFTTAQLTAYQTLQTKCIDKLRFDDGEKVLCVGVGTGNEVIHILRRNNSVDIVGADYSKTALRKAQKKASKWGKQIKVLMMDAQHLEFEAGTFDKVLCLHVMDFISDGGEVTREIIRVLKNDGQFVITYPSGKEDLRLGFNLWKENIRHKGDSRKNYIRIFLGFLVRMLVGIIYLPLLLRPKKRFYSRFDLDTIFSALKVENFFIEEYPLYHDFIVYGRK